MIKLEHIDHFVITVKSVEETCQWYQRVLGMRVDTFGDNRTALKFGESKINLHQLGNEHEPKAQHSACGTGDFCLITETPIVEVMKHLTEENVEIEAGPAEKTGANNKLLSVYIRDPDKNLIEISNII